MLRTLQFIHSMGLAHNDLNPRNIMLDDDNKAIVVDFDSCGREGEHVSKLGTDAWMSEDQSHSSRRNDYFSLVLLSRWLRGQYDPYGDEAARVHGPGDDAELQSALNDPTFQLDNCECIISPDEQHSFRLSSAERLFHKSSEMTLARCQSDHFFE